MFDGLFRRIRALIHRWPVLLLALALFTLPAAGAESVDRLIFLLEYVAADYADAVRDGEAAAETGRALALALEHARPKRFAVDAAQSMRADQQLDESIEHRFEVCRLSRLHALAPKRSSYPMMTEHQTKGLCNRRSVTVAIRIHEIEPNALKKA